MRIHRIRLRNYRGVHDCEVRFAVNGVTVVEGDNEVGKTSLAEALDLALSELDSSKKRQIKALQPVGRDVGPEVELEMSSGPYRFELRKRWLRGTETTLTISEPRRESFTSREAHQRVEAILDETLDADLWEALRVVQGAELKLPSLGVPSLGAALDTAAGADLASGNDDGLWDRILSERSRYWTERGQPRSERRTSAERVQQENEQLAELTAALQTVDHDVEELSRIATDVDRLNHQREEAQRALGDLGASWEVLQKLRTRIDQLTATHEAAGREHQQIKASQLRRRELIDDLHAYDKELDQITESLEEALPGQQVLAHHAEAAVSARDVAAGDLETKRARHRLACDDRDHLRRLIEVEQLSERLERVKIAQEQLTQASAAIEDASIDDDLVDRIERAHYAVVQAEASAISAAAHVTATALSNVTVRVDEVDHTLAAGESVDSLVDDSIEITVGDAARVRVSAGTDATETARAVLGSRQELRRLCEEAGVTDLDAARAANDRRKAAERSLADAEATILRDRRDLTLEGLARKVTGLKARIDRYAAERASTPSLLPDYETARALADRLQSEVDGLSSEHSRCEAKAASANKAQEEARLSEAKLTGELSIAKGSRERAAQRLAATRAECSDEDLATDLIRSTAAAADCAATLQTAQAEWQAAEPGAVKAQLDNARDTVARIANEIGAKEARQNQLRGGLEVRGGQGLHSRRQNAATELQRAQRDHAINEARADAAQTLFELFDVRRRESRQRYVEPVKVRIEQLGRIVFNPTFEVELTEDLGMSRRTLDGVTLDIEQLSTGAREQLGIIARLACAAIVSPDGGGAPVVIDDALGWSDPTRLQRMGAAIAAAGKHCQVIVLTCTPGRYAHVGNATFVPLPAQTSVSAD